jgi:hypothetical protein
MRTALLVVSIILLIFTLAYGAVKKVPEGTEFSYYDPSAYSVSLAGTFNNWDSQALGMTKDEEGTWRVVVDLPPGRYEYKFVVNGSDWMADPDNPKVVGDYGNSEIELDEEGTPVIRGLTTVVSNTPVNARVLITGWFRGTYSVRKGGLGDPRWRGDRPRHEMYVSINPTIGSDVKGSATIRIDSGEGDIREIQADLYAARLAYLSHYFDVTGYHDEEIVRFDDPLKALGGKDLPGTLWEDDVAFGKGTQGIIGDFRVLGFEAEALYSDTYDADIYNSPKWATPIAFDLASGSFTVTSRFDNTGTDVIGVRAKRGIAGAAIGGTLVARRNGWWVGFDEQPIPAALEQYRAESGDSASNWFEAGTQSALLALDAEIGFKGWASVFGEYGWTSYKASWDAGNQVRKKGDVFVDGKIDVPIGDEEGSRLAVGCDLSKGAVHARFTYEKQDFDGMGRDEAYVSNYGIPRDDADTPLLTLYGPAYLNRDTYVNAFANVNANESFVIFEHPGLPRRKAGIGRLELTGKVWALDLGLGLDIADREWTFSDPSLEDSKLTQASVRPSVAGNLFGERLAFNVMYEDSKDNLHPRMDYVFDRNTLLVRGEVDLTKQWLLYYNFRRVSYEWDESGKAKDRAFFDPHFALVWSPIPKVEIRLGYGVNPIYYRDQPVEGREIGRERWMTSYLWLNATTSLLDAEEALDDLDMISLMGVIAF